MSDKKFLAETTRNNLTELHRLLVGSGAQQSHLRHIESAIMVCDQFSTKLELLENIANMYVEPPKTTITDMSHWDDVTDENVETALALTSQLARIIWRDGPLEGQDRSRALTRLAHVCSRSGVTPSMTNIIIVSADKRWGKYHLRGESGVQEIQKIIARAYCE